MGYFIWSKLGISQGKDLMRFWEKVASNQSYLFTRKNLMDQWLSFDVTIPRDKVARLRRENRTWDHSGMV